MVLACILPSIFKKADHPVVETAGTVDSINQRAAGAVIKQAVKIHREAKITIQFEWNVFKRLYLILPPKRRNLKDER